MLKGNRMSLFILVMAILMVIINIAVMNLLPDQVALQITFQGKPSNFVPKTLFIVIAPIILLASFIFTKLSKKEEGRKLALVAIIVFAANIFTILTNINS